ncbi:oligopeptide ABC transporter ATP-binding protein OppF [Candidatus Aerophobetes bacterium]|uniref:Oligopeptide ABC transporter ATP-binding protein OppF n=1 Tax=Aerophobetes bacterium TaxID=2030807 RepID=A0A2A4YNF3_UNCAE|nr:MAG: oligopeptide ABC transporter ATP-binding protein OppF [Candidatus Aerophobetes bacterium]
MKKNLLEIKNLKKFFPVKGGTLKAVNDVSFFIEEKQTLGLVGESGCGKSTIGKTLINLYQPTGGSVSFNGHDMSTLSKKEMLALRKDIQMIFQDPYSSLNPRMTTQEIIKEPLIIHKVYKSKREIKERINELLALVGLQPEHANRFPHEFSGGQRQRIGIARALALNPKFIVCDEPIAALDVSIQAQIVNLLKKLQDTMGLTYLFISHDLAMVKHICNRVAVMYLGNIVEIAESKELYANPLHPYTEALLSAVPIPDPTIEKKRSRIVLPGEIPSSINPPKGCAFCTRCPKVMPICIEVAPEEVEVTKGHFVRCHLERCQPAKDLLES